jgi:putative ABC transport system ATP-binding protein
MIKIKALGKEYKEGEVSTVALKEINLDIGKGDFVAIMGPSGSGKSTLMHIMGLLDKPTSGTYFLDGKDTRNLDDNQLALLRNHLFGFVFQSFNLMAKETVFENVKLPLIYSGIPEKEWKAKIKGAIAGVGLSHREDHLANQLSGGEKQRVAIARALVNDPSVIFADEPTGNLDSKSGQQIIEILQDLSEHGKTIVLVTHESGLAEFAKRILFVRDGAIEKDTLVNGKKRAQDGFIK